MAAGLEVCVVVIIIMCGGKVCNSQRQLMTHTQGGPDHIYIYYRKGLQQCNSREDHGEGVAA